MKDTRWITLLIIVKFITLIKNQVYQIRVWRWKNEFFKLIKIITVIVSIIVWKRWGNKKISLDKFIKTKRNNWKIQWISQSFEW